MPYIFEVGNLYEVVKSKRKQGNLMQTKICIQLRSGVCFIKMLSMDKSASKVWLHNVLQEHKQFFYVCIDDTFINKSEIETIKMIDIQQVDTGVPAIEF